MQYLQDTPLFGFAFICCDGTGGTSWPHEDSGNKSVDLLLLSSPLSDERSPGCRRVLLFVALVHLEASNGSGHAGKCPELADVQVLFPAHLDL